MKKTLIAVKMTERSGAIARSLIEIETTNMYDDNDVKMLVKNAMNLIATEGQNYNVSKLCDYINKSTNVWAEIAHPLIVSDAE